MRTIKFVGWTKPVTCAHPHSIRGACAASEAGAEIPSKSKDLTPKPALSGPPPGEFKGSATRERYKEKGNRRKLLDDCLVLIPFAVTLS
jgi:hypothetical protein